MHTARTHVLHGSHSDLVLRTEIKYETAAPSWVTCFSEGDQPLKAFEAHQKNQNVFSDFCSDAVWR